MDWRSLWRFWTTWEGKTLAVGGFLLTIYYGAKQLLETYDWYLDRFYDFGVLAIVRKKKFQPMSSQNNWSPGIPALIPHRVEDIAKELGRKNHRVLKSLRRLENKNKVAETSDGGWCAIT